MLMFLRPFILLAMFTATTPEPATSAIDS